MWNGCANALEFLDQLVGRRRVMGSLSLEASRRRAETFGEFFSSKTRLLRETIDAEVFQQSHAPDDPAASFSEPPELLQYFPKVTSADVTRLIMQSPTKSCKLDPPKPASLNDCTSSVLP